MASDRVVINLEDRARQVARGASPRSEIARSEDARARAFVHRYGAEYRYVAPRHRWIMWDCKRSIQDSTGNLFALIRKFVLLATSGAKDERSSATPTNVASDAAGAGRGTAPAA